MKKLKIIFVLFLLFIGVKSVNALDTSVKVYDYAEVLSEFEEKQLQGLVQEYIEEYDMDMVLVTVKEHTKSSTKVYAEDFYDYNEFGIGDTNDGIIFVIDFSFGYTDIYISTTGEAIRMYDDERINDMLDNIAMSKDFGYYSMFTSFIMDADTYADFGIPDSNVDTVIDKFGNLVYKKRIHWVLITVISLIAPSIVVLVFVLKNKMVRKSINANYYLDNESVVIDQRKDRFINSHTTSVRINNGSLSGGVGGSSVSRGSSGISHGGGGRRL